MPASHTSSAFSYSLTLETSNAQLPTAPISLQSSRQISQLEGLKGSTTTTSRGRAHMEGLLGSFPLPEGRVLLLPLRA